MPQPRSGEPPSVGDRLVTAAVAGACGFGTSLFVRLLVMYAGGRWGRDAALPFWWTWAGAGIFAVVGHLVGPERTMNAIEHVWWLVGQLLGSGAPSPSDRRRGRF